MEICAVQYGWNVASVTKELHFLNFYLINLNVKGYTWQVAPPTTEMGDGVIVSGRGVGGKYV